MTVKTQKGRNERFNRRKDTLINRAHELVELCNADISLIIRNRKTGRYFTYDSTDIESWPPSKEQIQQSYPLPVTLYPRDLNIKRKKFEQNKEKGY